MPTIVFGSGSTWDLHPFAIGFSFHLS